MTVRVRLGKRSYDIVIQPEGLATVGHYLKGLSIAGKVGIVSNPNVFKLYGKRVVQSIKDAGYPCTSIIIPEGEKYKTLRSANQIVDQLVVDRFERKSLLLALGGGVIGDITGFAASMYLRGIPYIQVPTTLVSQVDSSVGGKTGVNHTLGKNLIGAFYQPSMVIIDTDTLQTLPNREWVAGLAEVIKYGMISDGKFFRFLEDRMDGILKLEDEVVQYLITRCCEIKATVVAKDERESGLRRILNYGHTIGHALESWGRYRKYIHGEAVGMGMIGEVGVARHLGLCQEEVVRRQRELIKRAGLPYSLPSLSFSELWASMLHDKKVSQGTVYCVLPKRIGKVAVVALEKNSVKEWFSGLNKSKVTH